MAVAAFGLAWSSHAFAGEMDLVPERFVSQPPGLPGGNTCQSIASNPEVLVANNLTVPQVVCQPNQAAFRHMIGELGFAIAPTAFYPARTTGVRGIQISIDASYTNLHASGTTPDGTPYWQQGTQGKQGTATNASPDSLLQVYSLKARKGLPLGFEIIPTVGFVAHTKTWVWGGDVRWSLLEGFRTGVPGYLPDFSIGAGARTLSGNSKVYLTTVGFDAKLSKPIPLAETAQLVPAIGYQRLLIFGDSSIVDFTPASDALRDCGYSGANPDTGAPICRNKLSNGADNALDFNNYNTFDKVRLHRHRGMVSLHYRYEQFALGGQFLFDLSDPGGENNNVTFSRQYTISFEAGAHF